MSSKCIAADAVKNNSHTLKLSMIDDREMYKVAEFLKEDSEITIVDLSKNQISCTGIKILVEALLTHKSVRTLKLRSNQIADIGAQYLAELMKNNPIITKYDLACNQIGLDGVKYIAESLKNSELVELNLFKNKIDDAAAVFLAEGLKKNRTLIKFALGSNSITNEGGKYLAAACSVNETLENLYIKDNFMEDDVVKEIEAALEVNRNIAKRSGKARIYVADIPCTEIFEARTENEQFKHSVLDKIYDLIRESSSCLGNSRKKAMVLIGDSGVGKSTTAHALCGKKLEALLNESTDCIYIAAKEPCGDIVIGNGMTSQTNTPSTCVVGDSIIIDLPGLNDTTVEQEIVNSFNTKMVFDTTDELKFLLCVVESDLFSNNRGNSFINVLSNFRKNFSNVECLEKSVSLIFTHAKPKRTVQNVTNMLETLLSQNSNAAQHKEFINYLIHNKAIHLFHLPSSVGPVHAPNLQDALLSSSYTKVTGKMVNIAVSKESKNGAVHLLNMVGSKFNLIIEVIVKALANPIKCLTTNPENVFCQKYGDIEGFIPSSLTCMEFPEHNFYDYFLELNLLSKLKELLKRTNTEDLSNNIIVLQKVAEVFAEYADKDDSSLKNIIYGYAYCLQLQYECLKFFSGICANELPDCICDKIGNLIELCHTKVSENIEYQVSGLEIDTKCSDQNYYFKALEILKSYYENSAAETMATAYCCLARIFEEKCETDAFEYYAKAIKIKKHLPIIYENIGNLYWRRGQYQKAIECFKVINNVLMIERCFKDWIEQDESNPHIRFQEAEYFESVDLFEHARRSYLHAASLSIEDEDFKENAWKKAKRTCSLLPNENQVFYQYHIVDKVFEKEILGKDGPENEFFSSF